MYRHTTQSPGFIRKGCAHTEVCIYSIPVFVVFLVLVKSF